MADLENMIDDNLRNLLKVFLKMEITSFSPLMFIKPSPPLNMNGFFSSDFYFFMKITLVFVAVIRQYLIFHLKA